MKFKVTFIVFLFLTFALSHTQAQGFMASGFVGLSAAQLEGDLLAGFEKYGLHAGAQVQYKLGKKSGLGLEITYTQKGSKPGPLEVLPIMTEWNTQLNYFEMPVLFYYNDWWDERKQLHRVGGHIGVSYGYLFSAETDHELYSQDLAQFSNSDFAFVGGFNFRLWSRLGFTLRYQRSFNQLYKNEQLITGGLLSYLWVIRSDFYF